MRACADDRAGAVVLGSAGRRPASIERNDSMTISTFDRIAASGGIAFTVLGLSTMVIAPAAPAVDAPAAEIRSYLAANHDRFGLSAVVMALAVLAVAVSLGFIHRRLAETDEGTAVPGTFLIAAGATVTFALAGVLLQGVLAQYSADGLDDSTLLALHRTWNIVAFMGPPLPLTIALLLAGVRSIQSGLFPRWLGWVAVVSALGGAATVVLNLGTSTRAPLAIDFGSFVLSCVWFTGVSVHALMPLGKSTAAPDVQHATTPAGS
jgi:hypothetical protein